MRVGDVGEGDHVGSVGADGIGRRCWRGERRARGTMSIRDRSWTWSCSCCSHCPPGADTDAVRSSRSRGSPVSSSGSRSASGSRRTSRASFGPIWPRPASRSGRSSSSGRVGDAVGSVLGIKLRRRAIGTRFKSADAVGGSALSVAALVLAIWFLGINLAAGPFPSVARALQRSAVVRVVDAALPPPPVLATQLGNVLDIIGFPDIFAGLPPLPADPGATADPGAGGPSGSRRAGVARADLRARRATRSSRERGSWSPTTWSSRTRT